MSTASAPSASALNMSIPLRIAPSTKIVSLPPTASTISGSTSAVAGQWSSTRPPWFETTMPLAPASSAFSAPRAVMMPFRMNGRCAQETICFNSSTLLLPAGGVKPCKNGRPAASMSIAMAKGSASCTSANFSRIVSISHGLMVGTPQPPFALSASAAPSTTFGSVPSPVKARMPAFAHARMRISL